MRMELVVRFGYGSIVPWCSGSTTIAASQSQARTRSRCRRPCRCAGSTFAPSRTSRSVRANGNRSSSAGIRPIGTSRLRSTPSRRSRETVVMARLARNVRNGGRWEDVVARSLMVLKAMTYAPTGGSSPLHDVAPGAARRHEELGLPLLLAARRDLRARRADRDGYVDEATRGGRGCCERWPATRTTFRSCTGRQVSGTCRRRSCPGCPATRARHRCGSEMPPATSSSSTCTGR